MLDTIWIKGSDSFRHKSSLIKKLLTTGEHKYLGDLRYFDFSSTQYSQSKQLSLLDNIVVKGKVREDQSTVLDIKFSLPKIVKGSSLFEVSTEVDIKKGQDIISDKLEAVGIYDIKWDALNITRLDICRNIPLKHSYHNYFESLGRVNTGRYDNKRFEKTTYFSNKAREVKIYSKLPEVMHELKQAIKKNKKIPSHVLAELDKYKEKGQDIARVEIANYGKKNINKIFGDPKENSTYNNLYQIDDIKTFMSHQLEHLKKSSSNNFMALEISQGRDLLKTVCQGKIENYVSKYGIINFVENMFQENWGRVKKHLIEIAPYEKGDKSFYTWVQRSDKKLKLLYNYFKLDEKARAKQESKPVYLKDNDLLEELFKAS